MRKAWIVSDAIVSPLGITSAANYDAIAAGRSGIRHTSDSTFTTEPLFASSMPDLRPTADFTRIEWIAVKAAKEAIRNYDLDKSRTVFIFSTTKGNVELWGDQRPHPRTALHACARYIAEQVGLTQYVVVSNACISGVLALITAQRYLASGKFDHALVVGADALSRFVVSGFKSLHAMSDAPCKPFDKQRSGLTLGEAAAAILLTAKPGDLNVNPTVEVLGGAVTNDANHISGPSRTGHGLALAISRAMQSSERSAADIDFISAHGTATVYNDEMEAKAFQLTGLEQVPLHSLKGYFGHTLGAAGVVETSIMHHSLLRNELIPTKGFTETGVSANVNMVTEKHAHPMNTILKTASGFGGCNAALLVKKINDRTEK